ncbi:MAG: zinc ribbon domain-containing protein [Myxococcota bacterium]|nr:zinc ribbon domain-containing protein [Myxococcota bacterium]
MPIYEYRCPDCGHQFEAIQKMSDDPIKLCPECGKEQVTKLLSQTAFHLKGGGWATDNYGLKSGSGSSSAGSSGGESGGSSSSSGGAASSTSTPSSSSSGD